MDRDFSALGQTALNEIRRHPGVAGGVVAVLAGVGLATLLLNQRTGPTRWERLRGRVDPRDWLERASLRDRLDDLAEAVRGGLGHAGDRAADLRDEAEHRGRRWFADARHGSRKAMKTSGRKARRYARDAGTFAKDHAREGGAILALATIAAAIGAAALETRRPDSKLRDLASRL